MLTAEGFLEMLSLAGIGFTMVDANGHLTNHNEIAEKWLNGDPGPLRGIHRRALDSRAPVISDTIDLAGFRLAASCVPVLKDNDVAGTVCIMQDLSQSDAVAEELVRVRHLESTLETIFELSYDGLIVVDRQGVIQMFNKAYSNYLNVPQSKAIGSHVYDIIPNSRLPEVMETGQAEIGHLHTYVGGQRAVVMRAPIRENGVVVGAVGKIMFGNVDQAKILASKITRMEEELEYYKGELRRVRGAKYGIEQIVGQSQEISQVKMLIMRAANSSSTVLITGETGTGKELVAHAIHSLSARSHGPFVRFNCASIPESMAESELFGYVDGAFTGASKGGRIGKFEMANGGTIFLDEVGDMSENVQAKVLRVLQEREIERLGDSKMVPVDARVIAATNKNLRQLMDEGLFRPDLYYRLHVFTLHIPPLSARQGDIEVLTRLFLKRLEKDFGRVLTISEEAKRAMMRYPWPGNVRELENAMERAVNMAEGPEILPEHLPLHILKLSGHTRRSGPEAVGTLDEAVAEAEKSAIVAALEFCGGNRASAARVLGIDRSALYKKMRRRGLSPRHSK